MLNSVHTSQSEHETVNHYVYVYKGEIESM